MKQKIQKLPESVVNQIAAGEVVENPASIVKELIENSLDAGAKRIGVTIVAGGQQLIRIEDDGCGMGPEDALLSLERHATSKIRAVEDLLSLSTMGFRGEALAAISSVSQFELKTSEGGVGVQILSEGGQIVAVSPVARNQGTTIEVRSLFYNVPARKKFQKSATTNAAQVARVVEVIALAHPEVSFSLNGKKELASADWPQRIQEIVGEHEHEVQFERNGMKLWGFVAAPSKAMINRTGQYLFINRRSIFSPLISKAVKEAFATRIGEHSYPPYVLFLEIPAEWVDVNVHPQKKEARFRDEGQIFRFIQDAISKVFIGPDPIFSDPISFVPPPSFSFAEPLPFFQTEPAPELEIAFPDRPLTVMGSYLLVQKEHLILVDLRAAHARVLFESLKIQTGKSQALIWPLEIEIRYGEETLVQELNRIGIESRLIGQRTIAIDALPAFLDAAHFPQFFEQWKEGKRMDQVAINFCRRLKKNYSLEEAFALWKRLQTCEDRLYDPIGNAIWKELKEENFEQILK